MADKKSDNSKAIMSHMESRVSSMKKGESKDMAKGPRKYAKGEVTNEVARPPKR